MEALPAPAGLVRAALPAITALDPMDHGKGFTLIELLVVVTIILIITSMSLASYNNFTETQKLNAETQKVKNALELAKNKAYSGDASLCGIGPTPPVQITPFVSKYSVEINGATSFRLLPTCLGSLTPTPYPFPTLASGITFANTSQTIDFQPVNGVITAACITLQSSTKNSYIAIQSTGLVEEKISPSPCP